MKDLERPIKAFANRRRLAIVKYLKKVHEASVGDIAEEIGLSLKATSKHLAILFAANIFEREQRSLLMFYSLSKEQVPVASAIISLL